MMRGRLRLLLLRPTFAVTPTLLIIFGLIAVTALTAVAARRLHVPTSILLVLIGLALGFVPEMPRVAIKPGFVLLVLLPPLLYSSGVGLSWRGFKDNLRPIMFLALGCVLFTATAVAWLAHELLGMSWAVGFVLGAVVSPPDAVAPMAIARRFALPRRILTILEGEGLVNDATALILFSFALMAVHTGETPILAAIGEFVAIVGGELAWGLLVGAGALRLRRWARDPDVEIALALMTPYVAFWVPEVLGGSGVLATVTAGLYVSWNGPRFISPQTRLQGFFVWGLIVYVIEGVIFMLTGLQARVVADGLNAAEWQRLAFAGIGVSLLVIAVRFIWVMPASFLHQLLSLKLHKHDPRPAWQSLFLVGFTGIRGVVSLAAALSIPILVDGAPFPDRGLILLVTYCVILFTLVGQGSMLPAVIRWLGLEQAGRREAADAKRRELAVRISAIDAALARLNELEARGANAQAVASLRRHHMDRRRYFASAECRSAGGVPLTVGDAELQYQLVEAERASVAELYSAGALDDEARRRIERELDLEDSRIRHAAESGDSRVLMVPPAPGE
jgi:Na+/H+ antiporter